VEVCRMRQNLEAVPHGASYGAVDQVE
jgi:hypothetical protein